MTSPIPMILFCPRCGLQHVDEATAEWANPPHRSHQCQAAACGHIWRPADVPTTGVAELPSHRLGTNDHRPPIRHRASSRLAMTDQMWSGKP